MKKDISVIGVPMDLGQMRRGVDMGPSAIRYAGIVERLGSLNYEVHDIGDIHIGRPEMSFDQDSKLRNLELVAEKNELLANEVHRAIENDAFPLVFGGDHSIAIGTL